MADFETPALREYPVIPVIVEGSMAHSSPYVAKPEHQEGVGFPGELVENWQEVAIKKLGELVDGSRALRVFLDTCVKCGACTDKCHYYLGTQDPLNMPVARQDLLRAVYRRYFTFAGKHFPKLVGATDLTEEVILAAADTFRAAAVEQLTIWSKRIGVDIVKQALDQLAP